MAWAERFISYMYCLVVRNISLHIDYWGRDLSPLRLSGKLRGRRSYDVSSFSVFKIHACHWDEDFLILAGFFAGFSGWCLSTTSSVSGGGSHVGMTTFSFQWITTEFFLWNRIYTDTLSATPFYDRTAIKLHSLILCVFYPKHYSYQHHSFLGVLDICLILSLYLHVLFLSVGFRYHYLWYCLYVYLLIICMYYFNLWVLCIIVYMYIYSFIYWKSGTSDLLVLMLFVLQCTDYK